MVPTRIENGIQLGWPRYSLGATVVLFIAVDQGVHRDSQHCPSRLAVVFIEVDHDAHRWDAIFTRVENCIHLGWQKYFLGLTVVFIAVDTLVRRDSQLCSSGLAVVFIEVG